jgi:acyl-CoA thioester hydrolase
MPGYVESYRGQVLASECDLLGHMNIQFYISRISHATWNMCYFIGISPEDIKDGKRATAAVHQENSYLKELLAGDIIHMETGILKSSNKSITFHNKLINSATGEIAMDNISTAVYIDLGARKAIPLTDIMREKVSDFLVAEDAT